MPDDVSLTIDGVAVTVPAGTTILKAAEQVGEKVPTICYHEACTSNALCRLCVVEVEGARLLQPACVAQVGEGMVVHTRSPKVERSRRTIVELLGSAVDLSEAPEIQQFAQDYHADLDRFGGERRSSPVIDDNPMYIRDYAKCILCWRCVQVCAEDAQYTYAINFAGRGFETQINVVDASILRAAQQNPEAYRDLVVRIGGYTDYFTRLSPEMQAEMILRTEYGEV